MFLKNTVDCSKLRYVTSVEYCIKLFLFCSMVQVIHLQKCDFILQSLPTFQKGLCFIINYAFHHITTIFVLIPLLNIHIM